MSITAANTLLRTFLHVNKELTKFQRDVLVLILPDANPARVTTAIKAISIHVNLLEAAG